MLYLKGTRKLAKREMDIVEGIFRGLSNKEIAYELGLTTGTVKVYTSRIYAKLGATSRTDCMLKIMKQRGIKLSFDCNASELDAC